MIYAIGANIPDSELYTKTTVPYLLNWLEAQSRVQLDLETNITRTSYGRKIRTIQFGEVRHDSYDTPGLRFVMEWEALNISPLFLPAIKRVLESRDIKKYIHNAIFEYTTLLNYDIVMESVVDTMLGEKVSTTGLYTTFEDEEGNSFYSLAGTLNRYFGIILDKSFQKGFGFDETLTEGHIIYAAEDVTHLDRLADAQYKFLKKEGLMNVINLENEAVLAFGDICWNGMLLNKAKWLENLNMAQPVVDKYRKELDNWLFTEPTLRAYGLQHGYIYKEDTVEFNPKSPKQKNELVTFLFPNCPGASEPVVKKYVKDNPDLENIDLLDAVCNKDWQPIYLYLLKHYREWLIEKEYFKPANTVNINWNSPPQVLDLFNSLLPKGKKVKDLSEKTRNTFEHPIIFDFETFKKSLKLTSSYGEKFLDLVDEDGRIRTSFNQILATGRSSSSKPKQYWAA